MVLPQGPKVEGALADPLWRKAPTLAMHPVPGQDGKLATTARILLDATHLYAAFDCEEPDPKPLATARARDGDAWADDSVELYVLPHPEVGYKQITINAAGAVFDQAFPPNGRSDRAWNANVKVAVAAEPGKRWTVALAVPLQDLGVRSGEDQTWRINVTRFRKARGDAPVQEYTWSHLPSADFQQPAAFGRIEGITLGSTRDRTTPRVEEHHEGLGWTRLAEPRGARRCFTHPLDPCVAWCATDKGLLATADDGRTWAPVEGAGIEALGDVTCLAVCAVGPDTLCLGTDAQGLFLSTDAGKRWTALGAQGEGYASRHIEWADFCPSDPTGNTLFVTHGLSAPGISVSRDLGATWEVLGKDRFLGRFVRRGETIVAIGSMVASEGKVWGIHRSGTDGVHWEETARGIRPAAVAAPRAPWLFLAATLDGAILQSANDGTTWGELVQSEGSAWHSLLVTVKGTFCFPPPSGAPKAASQESRMSPPAEVMAAYDPHRQGLCLSQHRFANGLGERQNRGLYVGPFVKSGAGCVANANGSTFYVAMNNTLWVGRWAAPAQGPAIVEARCMPSCVRLDLAGIARARGQMHGAIAAIAADEPPGPHLAAIPAGARAIEDARAEMKFAIQARVRHPRGPQAIRSVTADTSKLGGSDAAPLLKAGEQADPGVAEGAYRATIPISPAVFDQKGFRETCLVTVTATDDAGQAATWPAVVRLARGPVGFGLRQGRYDLHRATGPVTVHWVSNEGLRPKTPALRFAATGPGPWRAYWVMDGDGFNSAGLKWLTFCIKGDADQELFVHLMDHHHIGDDGLLDEPHSSAPVPLVAGGYLKAITPAYQKVRIPIEKLLPRGVYFLRWHTSGIGLSAPEGGRPGTYHIDLIQVEP